MKNKIQKWGNSNGVRLPKAFLDSLNLVSGDIVNVDLKDEAIVITKSNEDNLLKTRIAKYKGETQDGEFSWDEPRGREIW